MDRFEALATFVAVAEHNGFAPAARKLRLSASAATRAVAALEERLGVRLLNRTTRSVSLTDAGARFLERARQILADLAEAERLAEDERAEPAGRLTLTAPQVFGRIHVAPLLCRFLNAHPRVQAELQLSDRNINLVEEGIDLAVRIGALADSADIARRVGATRRVVVGSPAYLARMGEPKRPADLAGHRLIAFSSLTPPTRWRFGPGPGQGETEVSPVYVTNSADAAIWHAAHDGGLTLALSYQVQDQVRAGALKIVLAAHEPPPLPIQLVYPSARLLSVKVRALIDLALTSCDWSFVAI